MSSWMRGRRIGNGEVLRIASWIVGQCRKARRVLSRALLCRPLQSGMQRSRLPKECYTIKVISFAPGVRSLLAKRGVNSGVINPMKKKCVYCGKDRHVSRFRGGDLYCTTHRRQLSEHGKLLPLPVPPYCKVCGVALTPENSKYPKRTVWLCLWHYNERERVRVRECARKHKERIRQYQRDHREIVRKASMRAAKKYPEKVLARSAVTNALKHGTLKRLPCVVCGAEAQAHHEDYSKPLDVVWLCTKHHAQRHIEIKDERRLRCLSTTVKNVPLSASLLLKK